MRHVPLEQVLPKVFAGAGKKHRQRLTRAHRKAARKRGAKRRNYIDTCGAKKWSAIKNRLTTILGAKCWYNEVELVGGQLAIDHYRPTTDYWWLAFAADNFR